MKIFKLVFVLFLITQLWALPLLAEGLKDSESASHADDAANYMVEAVYEGTGFKIVQYKLGVLSHYSYLVVSNGKVLVVDPGRDVETYLNYAKVNKLDWVGTFLTHSNADFVAGHREMSQATGAPIYASHKSGDMFPHIALKDGEEITVGSAILNAIETPGHTPDGLCGLVSSQTNPDSGGFLLSGDTLFVGSVGRPDLMGGTISAAELAGMMFDSWNNKLSKLADTVVVLPAHGAGSLCGAHLSDEPSSTIGQERRSNAYLKFANDRSAFIASILTGLGDAPAYFKENAAMNKNGPEIVDWNNILGEKIDSLEGIENNPGVYVIDVRDADSYAASHIFGSVNIALRGRLETWTGIIVPFHSRVILLGNEEEVLEASKRLKRVGYNADYFAFGKQMGNTTTKMIDPADLFARIKKGTAPVIVDVRLPNEWLGMRIGEVLNIPLNILEKVARSKLNSSEEVVSVCNSAFRSSLAIGLLERNGFKKATSMAGGSEAWIEKGFPVVKIAASSNEASGATDYRNLGLPERISAEDLLRKIKDLPGSLEIIDIRPAKQVAEYNPLGAKAVDIGELIESQTWLFGNVPLVIVDRDGTLAMMAGGIISQKTSRQIKVLIGGVEACWREKELGSIKEIMVPSTVTPVTDSPSPTPQKAPPGKEMEEKPKKRKSAGC